jgi:hypothetical protein
VTKKTQQGDVTMERRGKDRRDTERRKTNAPVAVERRQLERRVKVPRRRQIDPTTCERDYSDEEVEFMNAMDAYKRKSGRMFPTCSEILEVLRDLGYARQPAALVASIGTGGIAVGGIPAGGATKSVPGSDPLPAEESTWAWEF